MIPTLCKNKKLQGVYSLIQIKATLQRKACSCKSVASIKLETLADQCVFCVGNGSEAFEFFLNICHALQLLHSQCTEHIMNKWVTEKQLEVCVCNLVLCFIFTFIFYMLK